MNKSIEIRRQDELLETFKDRLIKEWSVEYVANEIHSLRLVTHDNKHLVIGKGVNGIILL